MNLPWDQTATTSLYRRPRPQHICGVVLDHADLLEGISNFNLDPIRLNKRGSEFRKGLLHGCVGPRIADCGIGKIVHVSLDLFLNTLSQSRQINFLGFSIHTRWAIITDEIRPLHSNFD
jgi:hypothetical protein